MKETNYAGIDYGLGKSNVDTTTGIRYGMIAQNSVNPEALGDIYQHGTDLGFESAVEDCRAKLRRALDDYFSDYKYDGKPSRLDSAVEKAFDAVDGWADSLELNGPYCYNDNDGTTVQTTENGDLWVFKSPYYTHAQFCSPCVPGAGNLDSPCADGPKAYCLGHDWFDDGKAPYKVFNVSDDMEVLPPTTN